MEVPMDKDALALFANARERSTETVAETNRRLNGDPDPNIELAALSAKAIEQEAQLVAETGETTAEWFQRVVPAHVREELDIDAEAEARLKAEGVTYHTLKPEQWTRTRDECAREHARRPIHLPVTRERPRERRPRRRRRAGASSRTSSTDPGDAEPPVADPWRWADPYAAWDPDGVATVAEWGGLGR
jgi:hypothetical protein